MVEHEITASGKIFEGLRTIKEKCNRLKDTMEAKGEAQTGVYEIDIIHDFLILGLGPDDIWRIDNSSEL